MLRCLDYGRDTDDGDDDDEDGGGMTVDPVVAFCL